MKFPIKEFANISTPFYYYDRDLLDNTLSEIKKQIANFPFKIHYAMKANVNKELLNIIRNYGFGADCVSGWEVKAARDAKFDSSAIVFAGVGKTDKEISYALESNIECFNVESEPELEVINSLALEKGCKANVAIRVNPNIDAHTHKYITTGLNDNKFGVCLELLPEIISLAMSMPGVNLKGLHFHIGSQLTDLKPYIMLCETINELQSEYEEKGIKFEIINVGGGLGIDYDSPDDNPVADFKCFFDVFKQSLEIRPGQEIHFELGRSIVAQCGSLITRVTYVKQSISKKFVIVDAGMSDLIRPALYQAHHKIQNISSASEEMQKYDVVGPICESADTFGENILMQKTERGDLLAIRSAGAYGEIMASHYNLRPFAPSVFSK